MKVFVISILACMLAVPSTAPPSTPPCKDIARVCSRIFPFNLHGLCNGGVFKDVFTKNCALTCGLCPATSAITSAAVTGPCNDGKYCKGLDKELWKCSTKSDAREGCPKQCGVCGNTGDCKDEIICRKEFCKRNDYEIIRKCKKTCGECASKVVSGDEPRTSDAIEDEKDEREIPEEDREIEDDEGANDEEPDDQPEEDKK